MIFFFSATGNSQYAAEKLAAATGDRLISIGQALRDGQKTFDVSSDAYLGFVLPTFAWTLPGAVVDFLEKAELKGACSQYVYGVFTCGESTGHEASALKAVLQSKSIPLCNTFDVVMPDNFIIWSEVPPEARLNRILDSADRRLAAVISEVLAKKQGSIGDLRSGELCMAMTEISTAGATSKLYATEACNGCGLCAELCPTRCIAQGADGRPKWEGTCTMCLSCLHRCPQHAVQHGQDTLKKGRYVNPRTKRWDKNTY